MQHNKAYTLRPLSYNRADFDPPHCTHTLRLLPAHAAAYARLPVAASARLPVAASARLPISASARLPVAASARLPVDKLLPDASQCKRAIL